MEDFFDRNNHHNNFRINYSNTNNIILCKTGNGSNLAFLSKEVSGGVHEWKFMIKEYCAKGHNLEIGIWKTRYKFNTDSSVWHSTNIGKAYGWRLNQCKTTRGDGKQQKDYANRTCDKGDMINMILDLNKCTLSYKLDNKNLGVAFKDIEKTTYCAVVGVYYGKDEIELISYHGDNNDADDIKMQQQNLKLNKKKEENMKEKEMIIKSLKQQNNDLSGEIEIKNSMINSVKEENDKLKQENNDLRKQMEQLVNELDQSRIRIQKKTEAIKLEKNKTEDAEMECDRLLLQQQVLQEKIESIEEDRKREKIQTESYKNENAVMKQEIEALNKNNLDLSDECKELKHDLMDVKAKYNQLLRKNNIKESEYKEWDSDIITDWIIGLNQEYEQYEQVLRKCLMEESVDGNILNELDKNDLHRLGVKSLKHKNEIIKNIQRITAPNPQLIANEGNNAAPTAYI